MKLQEDVPLAPLTTFRLGPVARYLVRVREKEDVRAALTLAKEQDLPYFVLGGGSNTIFTSPKKYEGVILKMDIPGFEISDEDESGATLHAGAGENWDELVARSVEHGLTGIEALSAIPGSVGAAPIQNIGAYGQEVDQVITSVEAYDVEQDDFVTLSKEECRFTYRDSIFKHTPRYVVTAITLRLSKAAPVIPNYADPIAYFAEKGVTHPALSDIRAAIIEIRKKKLPDPRDVASAGSFFKNPFVDAAFVERVKKEYPRTVIFPTPDGRYKAGAGWMLEMLGLKGKSFGNLSLYEHHALVIVNNGNATIEELQSLVTHLKSLVHERFGIEIEPEPVFV